ncbi:IS3 family transposase [Amycolatopsis lurida]|uniref:IS3 family transposase n=1 Tax=Amycolatopsis lurida TaxID=31959 RepID=UPI000A4B2124|nr:IS3 family transposase [Amycolatopsis lurida]
MAKYAGPDEFAETADSITSPQRTRFSVRRMARLLGVSTSGYYAHVKRFVATMLTPRQQRRADLEVKISQAHKDSRGTYGSPRITAELRDRGEVVTAKTVAKIMASIGLEGISPRTFKVEDDGGRSDRVVPAGSGQSTLRPGPPRRGLADRHHVPDMW